LEGIFNPETGTLDGYGTTFYSNGERHRSGEFSVGQLDGENCCEFYPDGSLFRIGSYKNGSLHGKVYEFYTNGVLKKTGVFVMGNLHGPHCKIYHEFGNLKYDGGMDQNVYHG
jgi:antitoxin component YwqK of YwqJK toxin-antitoxin module